MTAPVTGRPPGLILELPASAADGDFAEYAVTVLGDAVALSFLIHGRPHRVRMLWVSDPLLLVAGRSNAYGLRIVDRNAADGRQLEGGRFEVRLGTDDTYDRGFFDRYRVFADAVEYLGPDDALPRRWPDRGDAWTDDALALEV